jgi:DNA-binding NtrC family response regulator
MTPSGDTGAAAEATIVVFEKRPRWAPELERQFLDQGVRVRACRMTADILPRLARSRSVAVLDLEAGAADCLQFLGRVVGRTPFVPAIVIGSARTAELEWPTRELGAVDFVFDSVSGEELAALCRRQWTCSDM